MKTINKFQIVIIAIMVCVLPCCTPENTTTVQFLHEENSLGVGQTMYLEYNVMTSDAALSTAPNHRIISVTSDREDIVSIEDYGIGYVKIYGNQVGRAKVSITIDDGTNQIETSCFVNTYVVELESVVLNTDSIQLERNSSYQLSVSYVLYNVTKPHFIWSSTDENVATVSEDGLVTAHSNGVCEIIVQTTSNNKDIKASCKIQVVSPLIEEIIPDVSALTLLLGDSYCINYSIIPQDAFDRTVNLTSSDTSIVRLAMGNIIETAKVGEANIFFSANEGNATSDMMIIVSDDITLFIDADFGGYVNINGVITGNFYIKIKNNCSQSITLTKCTIYDYSGNFICQNTDVSELAGHNSISLKGYTYGCNGFRAIVEYQYKGVSYVSTFVKDASVIEF